MMSLGSPVSNDGRGLKLCFDVGGNRFTYGSPVSNDGRGLKQFRRGVLCQLTQWFARQQ